MWCQQDSRHRGSTWHVFLYVTCKTTSPLMGWYQSYTLSCHGGSTVWNLLNNILQCSSPSPSHLFAWCFVGLFDQGLTGDLFFWHWFSDCASTSSSWFSGDLLRNEHTGAGVPWGHHPTSSRVIPSPSDSRYWGTCRAMLKNCASFQKLTLRGF